MAVTRPSGVPVMDIALVLGDTVPVRIRVDHALADCTPALAVKQTIGSADLIMTLTDWTREDDWQTASWVINTEPLQAALGREDKVDLVAEVVLVSPDGAQHTSRPIRVTVRRDILPADYAPPAEVLADWHALIATALAAQLPDALHNAGMYVTPASGTASMSPPGYDQDQTVAWSWARFKFGDDMLVGYQGNVCKVRDVYMWAVLGTTDTTPRWLDIWRRAPGGDWVLAARSSQAVASSTDVDLYMWGMIADTDIVIGDEVALHVYGGTPEAPVELPLSIARQMVTEADGRGLTDALDGPITDATVMPAVMLSCTYQDGVSVGGVNLATRAEVARVKDYADNVNKEVYASARQVAGDADQVATDKQAVEDARAKLEQDIAAAQAILAAMPQVDDAGNMTLGGTITVTAGIINGQLVVNNPAGSIGNGTHNQIHGTTWFYDGVEFRAGAIIRGNTFVESGVLNISKAASINCAGPATYGATINANGGINIPLAVGAPTDTMALNRAYALGMVHTVMMHQTRTYWLTSSCTATNGVTINHVVPGLYCEARLDSNGHTSLTMRTTGVIGGSNYNKILGYSLPIRNTGSGIGNWSKVSMLMGAGGEWTECPDAGMDDYRFRPVVGSAPAIARLVEVTLYYQDGYKARVRELIGIGNPRSYVVRTTTSAINHDSNTGLESAAYRLVIAQSNLSYNDELAAGVWLMIGGAVNDTVLKLADIRGWDTYHTSSAPALYVDVQAGVYGGMVQMDSPTILNGIGNNTYVRYGLEPYQRSWITTETEDPYTDPDQPTI